MYVIVRQFTDHDYWLLQCLLNAMQNTKSLNEALKHALLQVANVIFSCWSTIDKYHSLNWVISIDFDVIISLSIWWD